MIIPNYNPNKELLDINASNEITVEKISRFNLGSYIKTPEVSEKIVQFAKKHFNEIDFLQQGGSTLLNQIKEYSKSHPSDELNTLMQTIEKITNDIHIDNTIKFKNESLNKMIDLKKDEKIIEDELIKKSAELKGQREKILSMPFMKHIDKDQTFEVKYQTLRKNIYENLGYVTEAIKRCGKEAIKNHLGKELIEELEVVVLYLQNEDSYTELYTKYINGLMSASKNTQHLIDQILIDQEKLINDNNLSPKFSILDDQEFMIEAAKIDLRYLQICESDSLFEYTTFWIPLIQSIPKFTGYPVEPINYSQMTDCLYHNRNEIDWYNFLFSKARINQDQIEKNYQEPLASLFLKKPKPLNMKKKILPQDYLRMRPLSFMKEKCIEIEEFSKDKWFLEKMLGYEDPEIVMELAADEIKQELGDEILKRNQRTQIAKKDVNFYFE